MRPSRIIVGEVRQAESLDLLIALNSGLPGMCTIHANSAREAVTKMCTLPLLAGENVSARFVVPTVAASIDLVVHAALERDGRRTVREIAAVPGRVEGDVVEIADLFVRRGERAPPRGRLPSAPGAVRASGLRPHRAPRAGRRMTGMLLGLLLGLGLFLVWWSCWVPAPTTGSSLRRSGPLDRLSDEIVQAGFAGLSVRTLLAGTVRRPSSSSWHSSTRSSVCWPSPCASR